MESAETNPLIAQFLIPLVYCAGALLYGLHFVRDDRLSGRAASLSLGLGALLHLAVLSPAGSGALQCPVTHEAGFLSLFALCVVVVYLILERQFRQRSMGMIMAPFAAFLYVISVLLDSAAGAGTQQAVLFRSAWFGVHILASLIAYAAFAFSAVSALMLILLERALSGARMGLIFSRFPDLDTLDRMTFRAITIGFPALTVGLVSGAVWALTDARQLGWATDPKTLAATLAWLVYAGFLLSRPWLGWQGVRSARTALFGFLLVLLTQAAVGPLLSGFHSFR